MRSSWVPTQPGRLQIAVVLPVVILLDSSVVELFLLGTNAMLRDPCRPMLDFSYLVQATVRAQIEGSWKRSLILDTLDHAAKYTVRPGPWVMP